MWESKAGGGMRWAATAPYEAALALREHQAATEQQAHGGADGSAAAVRHGFALAAIRSASEIELARPGGFT